MAEELDTFKRQELQKALALRALERERRRAKRAKDDLIEQLKTAGGRRVFWKHLSYAGYFTLSFVQGAPDATANNEGMRAVGMKMFADLMDAAPEAYFQMTRENASEQAQDRAEDEKMTQEANSDA